MTCHLPLPENLVVQIDLQDIKSKLLGKGLVEFHDPILSSTLLVQHPHDLLDLLLLRVV
jgi:hypothetical protein